MLSVDDDDDDVDDVDVAIWLVFLYFCFWFEFDVIPTGSELRGQCEYWYGVNDAYSRRPLFRARARVCVFASRNERLTDRIEQQLTNGIDICTETIKYTAIEYIKYLSQQFMVRVGRVEEENDGPTLAQMLQMTKDPLIALCK